MTGRRPNWVARIDIEIKERTVLQLPVMVLYELLYGADKSGFGERNRARIDDFLTGPFEILDFTRADSSEAAQIRADLDRQGTPIGPHDILIAAQARRRGARLVSGNIREFARVPGLIVDNWEA
jgi:tRNA(fMet)-specific endonuclease VapC